eukprot:XP_014628575.1 uncharacterized protein LOC106797846 [Glycine max]
MDVNIEAKAKQQQEKLEFDEQFNNLHAHLEPPLFDITSQPPQVMEDTLPPLALPNTLESLLKSFNDSILYNVKLMMQQRLPPNLVPLHQSIVQHQYAPIPQPPLPPPTTVVKPHPGVPVPMVPTSEAAIPNDPMPEPPPTPPKSPPPIPQPLSTEG